MKITILAIWLGSVFGTAAADVAGDSNIDSVERTASLITHSRIPRVNIAKGDSLADTLKFINGKFGGYVYSEQMRITSDFPPGTLLPEPLAYEDTPMLVVLGKIADSLGGKIEISLRQIKIAKN